MRKLDRYVWREMAVPFLIGTGAVVLMFQANLLIALYKTLSLNAVPVAAVFQYVLYKTPYFLNMTLPVGMALASSLAISRLTRESELTAMRSAGVPILRVFLPVVTVGLAVAVANFWLVERVMPSSERAARTLFQEIGVAAIAPDFRSNVVVSLGAYTANIGSVAREGERLRLNDVMIFERPRPGEIVMYTAGTGSYDQGRWVLEEPLVRMMKGETLISAKSQENLEILEPISIPSLFQDPLPEEKSLADLRTEIEQRRKLGAPTAPLEVALHTKFSVPAACLVFALTSPVLAVWFARSGAFMGVLLSLILVLLYYNAYVISTEILGRNAWAPPVVAAWLPNAIIAGLGLLALRRLE